MSYRDDYRPIQGPKGDQGIQGPPGPQGIRGDIGPQGPTGPQGVRGPQGEIGEMGPRGPIGPQGPAGNNGARGPQGPEGPMGPRGFTGRDGTVRFEQLTPEQLKMITGPEGVQGPEGPQGARGPQGVEGEKGEPGETGPMGATGATGPAGPKGEPGPIGPQGLRGLTGPKGDPGDVNITEHVKDNAAWSSKQIVDYALHGKVLWVQKNVDWGQDPEPDHSHKIEGTENGYAKNLIIDGNTQVNESTLIKNYQNAQTKQSYETVKALRVPVYDKTQREGNTPLQGGGKVYTLIYKMDALQVIQGNGQADDAYNFNAKITVTKSNQGGTVEQMAEGISNGYVKFKLEIPENIDKIDLQLILAAHDPGTSQEEAESSYEGYQISFIAKDFMLLEGDFYNFIPPRYFYGEKGVGEYIDGNKYAITIESSNKNLIKHSLMTDNYYLKSYEVQLGQKVTRFEKATTPGSVATFFVFVKPGTNYTFSRKVWGTKSTKARLIISEYVHEPGNGEEALQTPVNHPDGALQIVDFHTTFKTGVKTNLLVIYVANFGNEKNWKLSEVYRELQLEEGTVQTPYEPNITTTKRIEIPQQLKHNYKLHWDNSFNQYIVETPAHEKIKTGIEKEELIHTYNDLTYVYVKSKIPATLHADFPIKAHNDYYTKTESDANIAKVKNDINTNLTQNYFNKNQFVFNDHDYQENLNFLRLPLGFVMQWVTVSLESGGNAKTVEFQALGELYHVQATAHVDQGQSTQKFIVMTRPKRDGGIGAGFPAVDVWGVNVDGGADTQRKVMVLAIGKSGGQS